MSMEQYVVYSHGFGVRSDDRGMFTDIALSMPEFQHVLFDYNQFSAADNTLAVTPLATQGQELATRIDTIDEAATVDVVAHSQGCIAAALALPERVRRVIFITPPDNTDVDRISEHFGSRPGSHMDIRGESRIPRRDGTTTLIPPEYWAGVGSIDVIKQYTALAKLCEITIIAATDDEVLDGPDFSAIEQLVTQQQLPGNHDFTGPYRPALLKLINNILK